MRPATKPTTSAPGTTCISRLATAPGCSPSTRTRWPAGRAAASPHKPRASFQEKGGYNAALFIFQETRMSMFAFAVWMAITPLNPDEVLATVNGVAITRRDVQAALKADEKRAYDEAMDDLHDVEHSAVRDYVGRQCIASQAKQQNTTTDAI